MDFQCSWLFIGLFGMPRARKRWPDLLSKFLKMIWCTPISGDDAEGAILVEQRLLPHPDAWISNGFRVISSDVASQEGALDPFGCEKFA